MRVGHRAVSVVLYQPVAVFSGVGHFQRKYMRVLWGQTKVSVISRCPKSGIPM